MIKILSLLVALPFALSTYFDLSLEKADSKQYVTKTYELTAYTAGIESTGKSPSHPMYGVTASGKHVREGVTIACPPELEFGTKVYIPHFDNTYTCSDRGGAIKGNRMDIYMKSSKEALRFGRRDLTVKIEIP